MKISRRGFLKAAVNVAIGSGIIAMGGYGGYQYGARLETKWLDVEQVQVPLTGLHPALEGLKIVQLSDIHLHPFTKIDFVREVIVLANSLQPDLIALTGDYVLRSAEAIFELAPVLATLDARYGLFAVLGNHDIWTDAAIVRAGLEEAGLPVLLNQGMALDIGSEQIYLAGVDDAWSGHPDLNAALANLTADLPTILLCHEPDMIDTYAAAGPISLQLSGHSHGGQVRLPGFGAPILPYLGQKYELGLYRVDEAWVYTNRGIGVIAPPIRLNCRPEITEITLISA